MFRARTHPVLCSQSTETLKISSRKMTKNLPEQIKSFCKLMIISFKQINPIHAAGSRTGDPDFRTSKTSLLLLFLHLRLIFHPTIKLRPWATRNEKQKGEGRGFPLKSALQRDRGGGRDVHPAAGLEQHAAGEEEHRAQAPVPGSPA